MLEDDEIVLPPSSRAVRRLLELKESGQPISITVTGTISLPVQSEAAFDRLLTLVEWLDTAELLRERIETAHERDGISLEELKARLGERHGVPH